MNINELGQFLSVMDLNQQFFSDPAVDVEEIYNYEPVEFDYDLLLKSDDGIINFKSSLIFQLESADSLTGIRWVLHLVIKNNQAKITAYPHLTYSDFPSSVRLENIYSCETSDSQSLIGLISEARDELMKSLILNLKERNCRELWVKEKEAAEKRLGHMRSIEF